MFRYTNHVCKKCFLQNDPFHKVTLNEDGVCSLCAKPAPEEARRDWDALEKRFAAHLDRVRGTRPYEGLIMMSGGKDSAYLADLLKETYGMRLLGFIIDINYEYPETFENAKTIARKLDLPYVVFRQEPEAMRRYYRFLFTEKALLQPDGGQVCTFCGLPHPFGVRVRPAHGHPAGVFGAQPGSDFPHGRKHPQHPGAGCAHRVSHGNAVRGDGQGVGPLAGELRGAGAAAVPGFHPRGGDGTAVPVPVFPLPPRSHDAPRARTPPVAADQAVLQDVHRLRVPPRKAVGVHGLSQQYQQLRRF